MVLLNKLKGAWEMLYPTGVREIFKTDQATPNTNFNKLSLSVQRDCQIAYKKYYNRLCLFATRLIDDEHSAEDIVTEVFVSLMEEARHKRFDDHEIKGYLYSEIKRKCFDHLKELKRKNKSKAEFEYILSQPAQASIDMEAELSLLILQEINKLPPQRKRIVEQMYLQGYTSKQVAERMDLSRQTVINQKVKALKSLRDILSKVLC